jgi:competence CoiA-like predicted nuclease
MLKYGLDKRTGRLVHISKAKHGVECELFAPCCGEPLVAKNNGKIYTHHFAHYSSDECSTAEETAAHLLAKEVASEISEIAVPVLIPPEKVTAYSKLYTLQLKQIKTASVERYHNTPDGKIFADVWIVTTDCGEYGFEMYVTHEIDDKKKQKILSDKYTYIEIPINKKWDVKEIKSALVDTSSRRNVISQQMEVLKTIKQEKILEEKAKKHRQSNSQSSQSFYASSKTNTAKPRTNILTGSKIKQHADRLEAEFSKLQIQREPLQIKEMTIPNPERFVNNSLEKLRLDNINGVYAEGIIYRLEQVLFYLNTK